MPGTMTERQQLQLAAKAAGIEVNRVRYKKCGDGTEYVVEPSHHFHRVDNGARWNPRDFDGDALRLAAKLGAEVKTSCTPLYIEDKPYAEVTLTQWNIGTGERIIITCKEEYMDDQMQAIRSAILGAAAEAGKGMLTKEEFSSMFPEQSDERM